MRKSRNRKVRKLGLEKIGWFSSCTERQLRKITLLMTDLQVPAGKVLARTGDSGEECFVVVSGSGRIVRDGVTLENLGPGSHYGEVSLLDGGPRTETVVADSDMELLVMSQREFSSDDFLVPSVARKMLVDLASRLRKAEGVQVNPCNGVEVGLPETVSVKRATPEVSQLVTTAR